MAEKEYIEAKDLDDFRDEIMGKFLSLCNYNDYNKLTLLRIGETIDKVYDKYVSKPLADVVEVVHAHWIDHKNGNATCSHCRIRQTAVYDDENEQNFCGHCGAKMDGENYGKA